MDYFSYKSYADKYRNIYLKKADTMNEYIIYSGAMWYYRMSPYLSKTINRMITDCIFIVRTTYEKRTLN